MDYPIYEDTSATKKARQDMVKHQIVQRGIKNPLVLKAMLEIPRHFFVPPENAHLAYEDRALPIGYDQTISQPFMVAAMTDSLGIEEGARVLEIGTGSGYQAAILCHMKAELDTIERIKHLADMAGYTLDLLGYHPQIIVGDGTYHLPKGKKYDAIIVTAGAPKVPEVFLERLSLGGRLIIPVGTRKHQILKRIIRKTEGFEEENLMNCIFVPLIGAYGFTMDNEETNNG